MLLRRELPTDVATIAAIHREAFGGRGSPTVEEHLTAALRADPGWIPALSIVAQGIGGEVVGHVVATEGRVDDVAVVGIGPVGVRMADQGRGVGSALLHAVLAASDALGYPLAALLGDPRYYHRFGFVPASSVQVSAPDPAWGVHFQVRTLGTYAGQSGAFRYAAPFDEL